MKDNSNLNHIGNSQNYWLEKDGLVDLSRGGKSTACCKTTKEDIVYDPERSALVIIDMQNFFLSEKLGRGEKGRAIIPAVQQSVIRARELGMKVIWLNWGVRPDLANLSPSVLRSFSRSGKGFGSELPNQLGPVLIKNSWSAQLINGLEEMREDSDIRIDKHRTSGFYGTEMDQILHTQGITTLFFAGVNTDQCVLGTLHDAYCSGYDSILLTDCTTTTSPDFAYDAVLYNVEKSYGFLVDSENFCSNTEKE